MKGNITRQHFTLFDTAVGNCGIVWTEQGIIGVQLPEASADATRTRLQVRFPNASESKATVSIKKVISNITALLKGKAVDLSKAALDMSALPTFHQRAYTVARTIKPGSTLSYGEVATQLGSPGGSRAVGQAMARNPFPIIVPCHRVLAAGGKLGGFTANGGVDTKQRMLQIEGVTLNEKKTSNNRGAQAAGSTKPAYAFNVRKALTHLRKADPKLATLMDEIGPFSMRVNQTQDVFLALAESIVYQQLHGKAAATIFKRVCELFPRSGEFFTAKDIMRCGDDKLRGAGLSQNKLLALRDLASKTLDGTLPGMHELHVLDSDIIIERFTRVRGIGRWTVEMLLMFRLGRPDVLPVDDFGVRKGFMVAFRKREMPAPKQLKAYGERWAPYRSVASWFLWRAADRAKLKK
jgi:methylated-DNA-[protein]-cysteine S-methyltransferase